MSSFIVILRRSCVSPKSLRSRSNTCPFVARPALYLDSRTSLTRPGYVNNLGMSSKQALRLHCVNALLHWSAVSFTRCACSRWIPTPTASGTTSSKRTASCCRSTKTFVVSVRTFPSFRLARYFRFLRIAISERSALLCFLRRETDHCVPNRRSREACTLTLLTDEFANLGQVVLQRSFSCLCVSKQLTPAQKNSLKCL